MSDVSSSRGSAESTGTKEQFEELMLRHGAEKVAQGAEAIVYKLTFYGRACALKLRLSKRYRHPHLDRAICVQRSLSEIRCMQRARRAGVRVPAIHYVSLGSPHWNFFVADFVDGRTLKQFLVDHEHAAASASGRGVATPLAPACAPAAVALGRDIALLHSHDVVHGDLTSSNVLVSSASVDSAGRTEPALRLTLIDFGLAFVSKLAEDRAVDLYVLERAMLSTHVCMAQAFMDQFYEVYRAAARDGPAVLRRLETVRARGRKKIAFG